MMIYKYKKTNRVLYIMILMVLGSGFSSCKKFLDLKPNSSLYIPSNLRDCQALLDNYDQMNLNGPIDGEMASDDYNLTDANWNSLLYQEERDGYIWASAGLHQEHQWAYPYKAIFNANMVLEILNKIEPTSGMEYNSIKGSALFFRGFAFYCVASLFCKPFDAATSNQDPGILLQVSTDVNAVYGRGTVQQTYDQIILDLKTAADLLPETSVIQSRPTRAAALAALARVYLSMRDYTNAGIYADASLKKYNVLLNYNSLNTTENLPFKRFHVEVVFQHVMSLNNALNPNAAKIIKPLYDSYMDNDLRKTVFFKPNVGANSGTYAFKGSYDGTTSLFSGLATDETYLIRAECYARAGKTAEALKDLNDLLVTRWKFLKDTNGNIVKDANGKEVSTYIPYAANNADEALGFILTERRKELLFRGLRWTDLRRLNKETRFAITLSRTVSGTTYTLPPNDLRYTLLIPTGVVNLSKITQNAR